MLASVREFHQQYQYPIGIDITTMSDHPGEFNYLYFVSEFLKEYSTRCEERAVKEQNSGDPRLYRAHLMMEELSELLLAMRTGDEVKVLDGLVDLLYVVLGTAVTFGLPVEEAFKEVHRSNMTKKFDPGTRMREKGPDYTPPNLEQFLRRQA